MFLSWHAELQLFTRVRQPMWLGCSAVCGAGIQEETMLLAGLLASFQSLLLLPTSKVGLSSADSQVGGFVYVLGPCGSLQ